MGSYNFRNRSYWLRRLENHGRRERVPVDRIHHRAHPSAEREPVGASGKRSWGSEWARIHKTYLHTLGNLTLSGYNSEYSDRPFAEKRDMPGGFERESAAREPGAGQPCALE